MQGMVHSIGNHGQMLVCAHGNQRKLRHIAVEMLGGDNPQLSYHSLDAANASACYNQMVTLIVRRMPEQ